jgi:small subunit ribosomal protein S14
MARLASINKYNRVVAEEKRMRLARSKWKEVAVDPNVPAAERMHAQEMLTLTRRFSAVRVKRRCEVNGRSRGVYRRFGMCRNVIRKLLMDGMFPGGQKSSW